MLIGQDFQGYFDVWRRPVELREKLFSIDLVSTQQPEEPKNFTIYNFQPSIFFSCFSTQPKFRNLRKKSPKFLESLLLQKSLTWENQKNILKLVNPPGKSLRKLWLMFRQKLSLNSPLTEPNNTIIILTGYQNAKNENNFVTVQGGVQAASGIDSVGQNCY